MRDTPLGDATPVGRHLPKNGDATVYAHTRFTVMGVLGVDPELSQTGGGTDRVRLSVSSDKGRESKWIKLTAFGKVAQLPMGVKVPRCLSRDIWSLGSLSWKVE
jgi:hypothetical protein